MASAVDLTGKVFGRLTVIERVFIESKDRNSRWRCICECGGEKITRAVLLRRGATRSCGCINAERIGAIGREGRSRTHGMSKTREYSLWIGMRNRCNNPNEIGYKHYGGRGIFVCKEWDNFETFYHDMAPFPEGLWIDRINNDGPYSKENCKWSTAAEQCVNKRNNAFLTAFGITRLLRDWARIIGIERRTLHKRIKLGWAPEDIVSIPLIKAKDRNKGHINTRSNYLCNGPEQPSCHSRS